MSRKRKQYSPQFKAKVAIEAIRVQRTLLKILLDLRIRLDLSHRRIECDRNSGLALTVVWRELQHDRSDEKRCSQDRN